MVFTRRYNHWFFFYKILFNILTLLFPCFYCKCTVLHSTEILDYILHVENKLSMFPSLSVQCMVHSMCHMYIYMAHVYIYIHIYILLLFSHVQFFCIPMDCSPPGLSDHGISQARILEWVAISFSRKEIFQTQGLNSHLRHWQADSLPLSHQGSLYTHTCMYIRERIKCVAHHSVLQGPSLNLLSSLTDSALWEEM